MCRKHCLQTDFLKHVGGNFSSSLAGNITPPYPPVPVPLPLQQRPSEQFCLHGWQNFGLQHHVLVLLAERHETNILKDDIDLSRIVLIGRNYLVVEYRWIQRHRQFRNHTARGICSNDIDVGCISSCLTAKLVAQRLNCLLYTSPSPRD